VVISGIATNKQDTIAWRIMTARKEASLTQAQLAAKIFVSRQIVSHWERGFCEPKLGEAGRIAIATGKPIDFLCPLPLV
jgi:DNA-binding XRE family transcriptional regulator